jgi:outer membrane protein OmpA-like peptidoglycan-associated protein
MMDGDKRAAWTAALVLLAAPFAAQADVIVRVGGAWAEPDSDFSIASRTTPPTLEGNLQIDNDGPQVYGDITWLFADHLGVEFWINNSFKSGVFLRTAAGKRGVGEVEYISPMVNLQWHFMPNAAIRPYVGAGVAYNTFSGIQPAALSIDDEAGWTAGAGIDIGKRDRGWFVNAFVKYIDVSPDARATFSGPTGVTPSPPIFPPLATNQFTVNRAFDVNPWVYGISVGYKFGAARAAPVVPAVAAAAVVAAPVVAAAPAPRDSDRDGVVDGQDQCPDTPTGDRVGPFGCSCDVSIQLAFKFDSVELTDEDKVKLDAAAANLLRLKFIGGEAGGYTDSTGDDAYNLGLSKRRAQAAVDYLAAKGVDPTRTTVVGYGEVQPIADNATAEGRAQNRRVVLRRTDCGPAR